MEQKIYFNGKETTQEFIDNYIKKNGGFMACKMSVEYNNGFIKYSTQTPQRQKVYVVITHCCGNDDEFTKIVGAYSTKDKALSKLWQKLETTIKLMGEDSEYKLDKNEDFYTLQNEDDGSIAETYIKEMEIE